MTTKQTDRTATADAAPVAAPLPEAPVSLTIKVVFRGYDTLVTLRDTTGKGAFTKLAAALDYIEANGGGPTLTRPAHAAPPPAGPQMLATGHATGPAGAETGTVAAAWYVVAPEPGGKERVSFWNPGREFAELSMVKPGGGSASLLQGVGPAEFGEHRIPVIVHFKLGKDRGKGDGSRYRDVTRIERAG